MISITKIFHFETAHAIANYEGPCKDIHGHSYELHICVAAKTASDAYIPGTGILVDFKEIKEIVRTAIVKPLDHKLILSDAFLKQHPGLENEKNIMLFDAEPTAENLLIYIKQKVQERLPDHVVLHRMRLYETKGSYAEWTA
ncbi:MAG TPA: 6-carboxytetrahydropterin synthase QueD [Bacteroidetes bacterium]|nr:6-carboxytetrahydropterin synthase QueD [Bacteroidota bacterium]